MKRRIVVLAFDGVTAMDVVSAAEVFAIAEQFGADGGLGRYDVHIVSEHGGAVTGWSGVTVVTEPWSHLDAYDVDTIIVPGGGPPAQPPVPVSAVTWLAREAPRARRICGFCTGTFLVAAAGLADGRRVTTHWQAINQLREMYPKVTVEADPIFVRDGPIWTSAGFTAGMDLALALIEDDEGHALAVHVARLMVMFLKRPGPQPQISMPLIAQSAEDPDFSRLHAWIADNLAQDLRIERLAEVAGMAPRTFERKYAARLRRTPGRMVMELRVDAAIRLMTDETVSLKEIARRTGFQDEQNLRRAFLRLRDVLPQNFRFRLGPDGASSWQHDSAENRTRTGPGV